MIHPVLENQIGRKSRKKKKGYIRRHRYGVGGPQGRVKEKEEHVGWRDR